jgi:hypothetical protein
MRRAGAAMGERPDNTAAGVASITATVAGGPVVGDSTVAESSARSLDRRASASRSEVRVRANDEGPARRARVADASNTGCHQD